MFKNFHSLLTSAFYTTWFLAGAIVLLAPLLTLLNRPSRPKGASLCAESWRNFFCSVVIFHSDFFRKTCPSPFVLRCRGWCCWPHETPVQTHVPRQVNISSVSLRWRCKGWLVGNLDVWREIDEIYKFYFFLTGFKLWSNKKISKILIDRNK